MENQETILNNSEDPEECKINDSNKNIDKDLCMFLPKNIVEEISEKQTELEKSNSSLSTKQSNKNNHIEINNYMKKKWEFFKK